MRTPKTNLENFVKARQKLRRIGEILRGLANLRRSYPYHLSGRQREQPLGTIRKFSGFPILLEFYLALPSFMLTPRSASRTRSRPLVSISENHNIIRPPPCGELCHAQVAACSGGTFITGCRGNYNREEKASSKLRFHPYILN